jgi:hypothetical protein
MNLFDYLVQFDENFPFEGYFDIGATFCPVEAIFCPFLPSNTNKRRPETLPKK